jgi:RNase P/RNase MRP subunit POP5
MSKQLQQLHTLTAKATIAHKMYSAGLITKEDFKKQLNDLDCHCHGDIVLEKKHADLDTYYRETLAGILKSCELEG